MRQVLASRIKSMRELLGLTQDDVAQAIGVSKEFISMVESEKRLPSLEVLASLASYFGRDISYFLTTREEPFIAVFRSGELGRKESWELSKVIKLADDYAFLEEVTGKVPPLAPTYPDLLAEELKNLRLLYCYAERLADEERSRLGLGREPIKDVFSLIESQGLHIIRREMDGVNLDGVFLFSEERGAFAIINASANKGRQVFTAAHEYCHYLKDRDKGYQVDKRIFEGIRNGKMPPIERVANAFASAFLMPREAISGTCSQLNHIGPEEVIYLKRYFGVSYQAMVFRLRNLNCIREGRKQELLLVKPQALEKLIFAETDEEKQEHLPHIPERFLELALDAFSMDKISMSRLAELFGTDSVTLRDVLVEAGLAARRKSVGKGGR